MSNDDSKKTTAEKPKVERPKQPSKTGTPERFFDSVEPLRGEKDFEILNEKKK